MCVRREFERNPAMLTEADPDAAMTAFEAVRLLEKDGDAFVGANGVPHSSL